MKMSLSKKDIIGYLLDFFEVVLIASGIFIVVYLFVGQLLRVTGDSMYPTLHDGEQIVAEKVSVKLNPLKQGEIVIFKHPENGGRLLIKRVIGLPGQTIKLQNGDVYINGQQLKEPYLKTQSDTGGEKAMKDGIEYRIPQNSYVLMGDNRSNSADSREFGPVSKNLIVGRAFLIYYPIKSFRFITQ